MTPPVKPEDDIGPFYKMLGVMLLSASIILLFIKMWQQREYTWVDFGMTTVVVMFVVLLWRPDKFDSIVKTIADALPFFKFKKSD